MATTKTHRTEHLTNPDFSTGPILRHMSVYDGESIAREDVYRLAHARVVFADHALLQHDFPQLRDDNLLLKYPELAALAPTARSAALNQHREDWLLEKTAYISMPQALNATVNRRIPVLDQTVKAFRPFHYGRAMIFSVAEVNRGLGGDRDPHEPGLLDVKGIGVRPGKTPGFGAHSNGLLDLSEALREVLFQKFIDFILVREGLRCRTVPNYGVIDTGFDRLFPWGGSLPSGILVRRAHRRPVYQWGVKDPHCHEVAIERNIERTLRKYGLTSSGSDTNLIFRLEGNRMIVKYGEHSLVYSPNALEWIIELTRFNGQTLELDGMNLQLTREVNNEEPEPQIVDFGAFWYRTRFTRPLVSLVACRPVRLGRIIWPGEDDFVQPHPDFMPSEEVWHQNDVVPFDEESVDWEIRLPNAQDGITAIWALAYRNGKLSGAQLMAEIDQYLASIPGWAERARSPLS